MSFLYLLAASDRDLELAQAELWALTGCDASGRVGVGPVGCDISRSAYVRVCGDVLARASDFETLRRRVESARLALEGFRIEVRRLMPKPKFNSMEAICSLADAISGSPNLEAPRHELLLVCSEGAWWFVRAMCFRRGGFEKQAERPHNASVSLGAQYARALVNLAAAPGDVVLDPCCGVGTCLIEARQMGMRAVGVDISKSMAHMAAANLRHFGFPAAVAVADARAVAGAYDAVVIDFPYGRSAPVDAGLYDSILNNVAPRAFRIAVVLSKEPEATFLAHGLAVVRHARVKTDGLTRHFYLLQGLRGSSDA